jgi:hypothetical protein
MSAVLVCLEKFGSYVPYDKRPAKTRITSLTEADHLRLNLPPLYRNTVDNLECNEYH